MNNIKFVQLIREIKCFYHYSWYFMNENNEKLFIYYKRLYNNGSDNGRDTIINFEMI